MTTLYGNGGTLVYIKDISGANKYSYDQITWNNLVFPVTVNNTNIATGIFTVVFLSNIILTSANDYFVCGSEKIQFGSSSLNPDGSRPTINITATNYDGLIQNGSSVSNGANDTAIYNLIIDGTGGSQGTGAGWFGQQYFGKGTSNCSIINCSSSGDIKFFCGGIVGRYAEKVTLIGCSSSGDITDYNAGGIAGAEVNALTIKSCWSTGNIAAGGTGDGSGGIVGANCYDATITNCYFTGAINGNNSGGIIGSNPGYNGLLNITNCYSTGAITGTNAGGICGSIGTGTYNIIITNCYTSGNLDNSGSNLNGAICGFITGATITLIISNCYTTGTVVEPKGYIIANETIINDTTTYILLNNYSEAKNSSSGWHTNNAQTALDNTPTTEPGAGTVWISTGINQSYELLNMGYTPYSLNNISGSELVRTANTTVIAGTTSPAAILSNKNYIILSITGGDPASYTSIAMDLNTGVISTTAQTVPGTYTIILRNDGSYNVTAFLLLVNAAAAAASEQPCCARPMYLTGVNYDERVTFIAGNTLLATNRRGPLSYSDIMYQKKAKAAKLS